MAENVVNYKQIIAAIGFQVQKIWTDLSASSDPEIASQMEFVKQIEISDEQMFVKKRDDKKLRAGTLYIIVKFGKGSTNFGSSAAPVSLTCLGVANKVRPAQLILGSFASTWTTKNLNQGLTDTNGDSIEVSDVVQVWNTPEIISNFNVFEEEFRNLYSLSGVLVIGPSAVRMGEMVYHYVDSNGDPKEETINIMAFQDGYRASPDTQPFGNTKGFSKSEVDFSTYTFSITTYLLNDLHFVADVLAIRGFRNRNWNSTTNSFDGLTSYHTPNKRMIIELKFTNGFTNYARNGIDSHFPSGDDAANDPFFSSYIVVDSAITQEIAGIPMLNVTFTH